MRSFVALLFTVTLFACTGNAPQGGPADQPSAGQPGASLTGTVLERIDVSGGMYLRLSTSDGEIWAAVSPADVDQGAEVTVVNAVPMDGFESKALQRTFDRIVFGTLAGAPATEVNAPPMMPAHGASPSPDALAAAGLQHPPIADAPVEGELAVDKAEGDEGRTIAEVYALRASLKGAPVAVRGKVVKVNVGIMGRNWIHLRDGSGSRDTRDDDLTVTTSGIAEVGDIVLVRGIVNLDRDFGAGYSYPVIVEDATVSKQ